MSKPENKMKTNLEKGFSLIELLLVVVIIGIVAAVGVPNLVKGIKAAENGSTISSLRVIHSTQVSFYSQNGRFGRLSEINSMIGGGLGTVVDPKIIRGQVTFESSPANPTDDDLRTRYLVTATVPHSSTLTYKYELSQTGEIMQVDPTHTAIGQY